MSLGSDDPETKLRGERLSASLMCWLHEEDVQGGTTGAHADPGRCCLILQGYRSFLLEKFPRAQGANAKLTLSSLAHPSCMAYST
jgi:hypothetical protein